MKEIPGQQGGYVNFGGKTTKQIDNYTKDEMIQAINYLRSKQPMDDIMEQNIIKLAEKHGISLKSDRGTMANKLEDLVSKTKTKDIAGRVSNMNKPMAKTASWDSQSALNEALTPKLSPAQNNMLRQWNLDPKDVSIVKQTLPAKDILKLLTTEEQIAVIKQMKSSGASISKSTPMILNFGKEGQLLDGTHKLAGALKTNEAVEFIKLIPKK
jgi:hypothetical protein